MVEERVPRASVSRARDAEDASGSRPWRAEGFTMDVDAWRRASGTSAQTRWEREPVSGFRRRFVAEKAFDRQTEAAGLEQFARALVDRGVMSRETLDELAYAMLIPTPSDMASVTSLEERLEALNKVLTDIGVREKTREQIISRAIDACGGAVRGFEKMVDALEARLLDGIGGEDGALNYVLRRVVTQLKYLRSQESQDTTVALRVCVGEITNVSSTQLAKVVTPSQSRESQKRGGMFACCSSKTTVRDDDDDDHEDDADGLCTPSERSISASTTLGESLECVVRVTGRANGGSLFASTCRKMTSDAAKFNVATPFMFVHDSDTLEIDFHSALESTDPIIPDTVSVNARLHRVLGSPCALMIQHVDYKSSGKFRGRITMRVAELAETTRKREPHKLVVLIEKMNGTSPSQSVGQATIYVDKFVESFADDEAPSISSSGEALQKAIEVWMALKEASVVSRKEAVHAFTAHRGACPSIAALAEMFVLCTSWRFEVEYIEQLSLSTAQVAAASAAGRLTLVERKKYDELRVLILSQLEAELRNVLPTASVADDELIDALDMEMTTRIVRAAIPLYALTLGGVSVARFMLRLKKIVRECAHKRCVEHMMKENPTKNPPTMTSVIEMIRKLSLRLSLDEVILAAFPREVDALSEAAIVGTKFMQDVLTEIFRGISQMRNPPAYDAAVQRLDKVLLDHRKALRDRRLYSALTNISSKFIDRLLQPALEETLLTTQREFVDWVQQEIMKEKISLHPLDTSRGVMYSASCSALFCVLFNVNKSAQEHILQGDRASFNVGLLSRMCFEMLQTYVNAYEQACLSMIQEARNQLMQQGRCQTTNSSNVEYMKSLMPEEFYTRLSNIHQAVLAIEPFMEELPLLWCSSQVEFDEKLKRQREFGAKLDEDDTPVYNERAHDVFDELDEAERAYEVDFPSTRIVQRLRTARANVIASLTELIEERIAPFVRVAILDAEAQARSIAVQVVFTMMNAELKVMNQSLASGAFRLVLSSMHRGACDAIEQLVLHRPMEEGSLESGERWRGSPTLTESQHSFVVELVSDMREFFYSDGAGEPETILNDSEGRLRRLLNLWFTPTVEVVREFWHAKEGLSRAIAMANGKTVRLREIGGVSVQDILRFLRQRTHDSSANNLFEEQNKLITFMSLRALFGNRLKSIDSLLGAWVCRDKCGLIGRLYVTSEELAFSTSGISIDHPHDSQTAMVREIRRIANVVRIDAPDGTPGVRITFDDKASFVFSQFCGMLTPLNVEARERDSCVALIRVNPCFLKREVFLQDVHVTHSIDLTAASAHDLTKAAQALEPPNLPEGEKIITNCVCARVNGLARDVGKFFAATESCVFLPVSGAGQGFTYQSMLASSRVPKLQTVGWKNADIIIPMQDYLQAEPMRLTSMTKIEATSVFEALSQAIAAYSERQKSV